MGPVFIWSAIEPSTAIVSACLPHLAPLRRLVRNKISSTAGRSHGPSAGSAGTAPWRSKKSGTESQKGASAGALFTIGGSRFSSFGGGDGRMKLDGDEVGLTDRGVVTAGGGGKSVYAASGSDENVSSRASVVHSSFAQEDGRTNRIC